jgi:glycosyltransferase involved in cell wall biosynthesis
LKRLFVNFSISWGGGEFWHFQHAVELSRRGYSVSVLTNSGSVLRKKLDNQEIPLYTVRISNRSFANPFKHLKIIRIIKKVHPDCIILNGSNELKLAGIASNLMGVPRIIYRRGNAERVKAHFLNRFLIRNTTHLITNSSFVMSQLRRDFSQDLPDNQTIIPNGIHLNSPHVKSDYSSLRIAVLGRLSKEKGVDLAIRAFDIIRKKIPEAKLIIIGEGQESLKLKALTDNLGMNGEVQFTGFLENCNDILSGCSMLMIPSRWEGFSFARLEAMSLKLPIIAFELDSLKENLCQEPVISFVKPYDINELAEKSVSLLTSPDKLKIMGENGYMHAREVYNLDDILDQFEKTLHG